MNPLRTTSFLLKSAMQACVELKGGSYLAWNSFSTYAPFLFLSSLHPDPQSKTQSILKKIGQFPGSKLVILTF